METRVGGGPLNVDANGINVNHAQWRDNSETYTKYIRYAVTILSFFIVGGARTLRCQQRDQADVSSGSWSQELAALSYRRSSGTDVIQRNIKSDTCHTYAVARPICIPPLIINFGKAEH